MPPTRFTKDSRTSFFGKLRIFAYAPYGNGTGMAEVEFGYSMRDQVSGEGVFEVFSSKQMGDEITGLYLLTGVASGQTMGVALVGGNYGGFEFSYIKCDLEITVLNFGGNEDFFNNYSELVSTQAADVTPDDITDAIDLLSVAATVV